MLTGGRGPHRDRWWLVVAAGVALFMGQLDATIVNVALPTLEDEFATTTEVTQWIVLAFVLPLIGLVLPAGRWLDSVGLRAALTFSVTGFAVASTFVGVASNVSSLIAARALQGTFGAIVFTVVPVLATVAVSPGAKGRAMALVMTLGPLGAVSGPMLGGIAIDTLGWRWVFFANVPVAAAVILIGYAHLPASGRLRWPGFAIVGQIGLLVGAVGSILIALTFGVRQPVWLALATVAIPLVIVWLRLDDGRSVVALLSIPTLRGAHVALALEMAAVAGVQFLIPFHLTDELGLSPAQVGFIMLATPVAMIVAGGVAGVAVDRGDAREVAHLGAWMVTGALGVTASCVAFGGGLAIAAGLALLGLGAGVFAGPNQAAAMSATPTGSLGTTSATTGLARQIGVAAGPAMATTAWAAVGDDGGLVFALAVTLPVCLIGALALGRRRPIFAPAEGVGPGRAGR